MPRSGRVPNHGVDVIGMPIGNSRAHLHQTGGSSKKPQPVMDLTYADTFGQAPPYQGSSPSRLRQVRITMLRVHNTYNSR